MAENNKKKIPIDTDRYEHLEDFIKANPTKYRYATKSTRAVVVNKLVLDKLANADVEWDNGIKINAGVDGDLKVG